MPLALGLAGRAEADQPGCGGTLSMSQQNRRRALGYVEVSGDEKRRCGLCTYFSGEDAGCGACQMLSGSLVSINAVCNSFVAREH